jgi:tetratricopeptide (TPR) repeat protein
LFISLNYYHSQTVLIGKFENTHEAELKRLRSNYEIALSEFFKIFWLTSSYGDQEKALINKILEVKYTGWVEKTLMISAITLNLWRTYDDAKLMLLFDCCQAEDQRVKQRALVGLCLVLVRYNHFIPYFPAIRNRLVLLADDFHIVENFHNIIIQLISTAETDKISKKMREEIMPEMLKISPLLKDKMDADSLLNKDEWDEENPAWQEIIEKSGVSDKLHELNELQMEGADVYMSTFSMLKNFPFFAEFSNWFLPFDGKNSNVNQLFTTDDKTLLTAFMGNNLMCNSDKYSFCLSILQMPENQRGMLRSGFKMESEQLNEISKDEAILTPDLVSKNISKQYIQDLFRVFKLHPQHADFSDIFDSSLSIHRSFLFDILSTNTDFNTSIAEYYFTKNHYDQALEIFEKILLEITPTAAIYQKVAYSYQQISQISKALDAYLKADIIEPDDVWTIRKIALCYRLSGNFEKALEFYQHADYLKPNQSSILLRIGHCFLELKKYKEALDVYFKLDAEDTENPKVWRAITWCAFVSGNIQQAEYYANKLIETAPTTHDYLNAGHILWCKKQPKTALEFYKKSLDLQQNNWELFLESFLKDKMYLAANGVDMDEIPLMLDALK